MKAQFREMLTNRQKKANTVLCVGLDPLVEKMPKWFYGHNMSNPAEAVLAWMKQVVYETSFYTSVYKPQHAYWEAIPGGVEALQKLVTYIHQDYPDIVVFMDAKRGDIDRTQAQYGYTHFMLEKADGLNYNPYMGEDTLSALVDKEYPGRALVGLGRTSNPKAWRIQDQKLENGSWFWAFMVEEQLEWSRRAGVIENAGIVMGAAHKDPSNESRIYSLHLSHARQIIENSMWMLIPGIGTQGGFVEETIAAAYRGPGSIAVNSSSGIIFADEPSKAAEKLRDQMRAAGANCK